MYLVHNRLFSRIRSHYFRKILRDNGIRKGMRVLDYGCGTGDFIFECESLGIETVGVDNSAFSVKLAKQRGLDVIYGDINSIPVSCGHFDLILLHSVIEHVNNPVELVQHLVRHLQPNGILIISSPTPGCYFWDDPTHVRPFTPKSLSTLADIVGLSLIDVNYVATFLLGLKFSSTLLYRILNMLPISLGSNIVARYRRDIYTAASHVS